jgi:hypothetical protein
MFDTYWYDYSDCYDIKELIAKAVTASRTDYVWLCHRAVDYTNFNLRYMPHRHQTHMLHAWPSHDNPQCYTTWLIPIDNNSEICYHDGILPIITPPLWNTSDQIQYDGFNFNWYPDVWDWNKQHHFAMNGTTQLSYTSVGNGAEIKYHTSKLKFNGIGMLYNINDIDNSPYEWNWILDSRIDYTDFNFDWLPDAWDADKIHEFCTWGAEQLSYTRLMHKNCSNERVYHHSYLLFKDIPKLTETMPIDSEWIWIIDERIDYSNFNFNWLPDAWDINKIHAFAMNGTEQLCYTFLHNTKFPSNEIKYHDAKLKFDPSKPNDEWVWEKDDRIDYNNFDFSWLPDEWDADKTHVFCMAGTQHLGYTKLINKKNKSPKTVYHRSDLHFLPQVRPIIYWQDYTNTFNLETLQTLAMGNEWTWIADRRIDYSQWDFEWLPDGWDTNYIHAFTMADKEQLSYTVLIHRDAITNFIDYKYHQSSLKFNDTHADMCFLNTNSSDNPYTPDFQVRLITTMEESIKAAVKKCDREWLWIYSDVCEYDGFDWNWLPDLDQRDQIHCWPSGTCKKGDTFLIHVPSFNADKLKFNFEHEPIQRKRWPVALSVTGNGLAWDLNNCPRNGGIYIVYSYNGFLDYPDVCLWNKRPVVSLNRSNSTCLVPRDCIVDKEIYEYPHLLRYPQYGYDIHTDVIFISNGEPMADENYKHLLEIFPNAKRSDGVVGRELAYKTAASLSDTPWFYAVFAKTWVLDTFDFSYSPDYWQEPKHYIFHSRNPLNKLEYGAMNINLYNKKLVLETKPGLDFTLSQKHTVIPICASESRFNSDAWITWRSAFREVLKLRQETEQHGRIEIAHRLHVWKTVAEGENAEWCLRGANDADQYYTKVGGDPEKLQLSFDWKWLKEYYDTIY